MKPGMSMAGTSRRGGGRSAGSVVTPTGTYFGNMTAGPEGLAGHHNGDTSTLGGYTTNKPAWSGMTWSGRVWKVLAWSVGAIGFIQDANPTDTRVNVWAKQGSAPASSTDGTLIGTTGDFSDTGTNFSKEILSTDVETSWDHVWIEITATGGNERRCAEWALTESV